MSVGGREYETVIWNNSKSETDDEISSWEIIEYLNSSEYVSPELHNREEMEFNSMTYGDELAYVVDQLEEGENDVKRVWEYSAPEKIRTRIRDQTRVYGSAEFDVPEKSVYVVEAGEKSALVGHGSTVLNIGERFLDDLETENKIDVVENED